MHLFLVKICKYGNKEFVSKTYCGVHVVEGERGLQPSIATEENIESSSCENCLNAYLDHMERCYRKAHEHLNKLKAHWKGQRR